MESDKVLPVGNVDGRTARRPPVSRSRGFRALLSVALLLATYQAFFLFTYHPLVQHDSAEKLPLHAEDILDKCRLLDVPPGPPPDFHARPRSDRFVPGTKPTLIQVGENGTLHRIRSTHIACRMPVYGLEDATGSKLSMDRTFSSTTASSREWGLSISTSTVKLYSASTPKGSG